VDAFRAELARRRFGGGKRARGQTGAADRGTTCDGPSLGRHAEVPRRRREESLRERIPGDGLRSEAGTLGGASRTAVGAASVYGNARTRRYDPEDRKLCRQ
jgi:hypothetical protein